MTEKLFPTYEMRVVRQGLTEVRFSEKRCRFRVQKLFNESDNVGVFNVFNLPTSQRQRLARRVSLNQTPFDGDADTLFFEAGWNGENSLLFRGVILEAINEKAGPDWITNIRAYTVLEQVVKNVLNRGYGRVALGTVLEDLFAALNWGEAKYSASALARIQDVELPDFLVKGSPYRQIAKLMRRFDLNFTITEDRPIVVADGEAIDTDIADSQIPVINEATGMIGAPAITKTGVEVSSLLDRRINMLHSFIVEADTVAETLGSYSQRYVATGVEHFGDNRGDEWFSSFVGTYPNIAPKPVDVTESQPAEFVR